MLPKVDIDTTLNPDVSPLFSPEEVRDMRRVEERSYTIKEIQWRHREIMRLKLKGLSNKEIAIIVGVTPQNVSDVMNSPQVKAEMEKLSDRRDSIAVEVQSDLVELAPEAVALYRDILSGKGDGADATLKEKLKVADSVLDRTGFGKVQKVEFGDHLTTDDVYRIIAERKTKHAIPV